MTFDGPDGSTVTLKSSDGGYSYVVANARKTLLSGNVYVTPVTDVAQVLAEIFHQFNATKEAFGMLAEVKPVPAKSPTTLPLGMHDISFDEYRAIEAINFSSLKQMGVSPLAYAHAVNNGGESSKAMSLGTIAHCAVLQPELFERTYVSTPETRVNEAGKRVKYVRNGRHWDAFQASYAGYEIISESDMSAAREIQRAVRSHPWALSLLLGALREQSFIWVCDRGILRKSRLDAVQLSRPGAIVDLKTADDITPEGFARSAARYKYHWQAAFYQDAVEATHGVELPYYFVVAQPVAPYDVVVYEADEEFLTVGREEYMSAVDKVERCRSAGKFPGLSDVCLPLSLPQWAIPKDDEIIVESSAA